MNIRLKFSSVLVVGCVVFCASAVRIQAETAEARTRITVRVQAKGGKYLGDDIGGAWVSIRNQQTGEILASGITHGDAGDISNQYMAGASARTIITPTEPPKVSWVVAGSTTSQFTAELALDRTAMIEISAWGATGGLQAAHRVISTQWAVPGKDIVVDFEIAGLLVQIMEPATHHQLPGSGGTVALRAHVAMMCGCPINVSTLWLPSDFDVSAQIRNIESGHIDVVPLKFGNTGSDGLFKGTYNVVEPGFYEATIVAVQRSTGNMGAGQVTFFTVAAK
jgi:hypothetical protein